MRLALLTSFHLLRPRPFVHPKFTLYHTRNKENQHIAVPLESSVTGSLQPHQLSNRNQLLTVEAFDFLRELINDDWLLRISGYSPRTQPCSDCVLAGMGAISTGKFAHRLSNESIRE